MSPASEKSWGQADPQAEIVAFLGSGSAFAGHQMPVRIDTHAASIFLSGERAWKLKRAVRFDYLDFSTSERRHTALDAELLLNRRTAPGLYHAVHSVTRGPNGQLAIGGEGAAVDWLLEMQRFPDGALLDTMAGKGKLAPAMLLRLADRISEFHAAAGVVVTTAAAARMQSVIDGNTIALGSYPAIFDPAKVRSLHAHLTLTVTGLAAMLDERGRTGRVRHGHGDLHLANIAMIEGEPTLFDCLEFSVELATVDVLYDLAFLLMDFWQRGLRTEASIVFNRYLDQSAADEDAIALLPLFLAVRATIRAHVLAAQSARAGSEALLVNQSLAYFDLASDLLEDVAPRLIAIGGLSGTGKSTLARSLGGHFGRPPGARVLRSDVVRKQSSGVPLETPLPVTSYSSASSVAVYARLGRLAAAVLSSGHAVIADAVFAKRHERDAIAAVAAQASIVFAGVWLEVPGATLLDRIALRGPDASDADVQVAAAQASMEIGELGNWKKVLANGTPEAVAAAALAGL
jgi:hypothetical protein